MSNDKRRWIEGIAFLIAFGLTALGFCIAWRLDSTHGFHALVNLLLIPMWLLSGALFPISGASTWVGWLMRLNPLTYGVAAVRHALYAHAPEPRTEVTSFATSIAVTALFALVVFLIALLMASRRQRAGSLG